VWLDSDIVASKEEKPLGIEVVLLLWILSWVAVIWVISDAGQRYENGIGCLWGLVVLALGPIALIAYLIVRPPKLDEQPGNDYAYRPPSSKKADRASSPDIKPTKNCEKCGAENKWYSQFCKECRAEFPRRDEKKKPATQQGQSTQRQLCKNCGAANEGDALFCNRCGHKLGS